MQFPTGLHFFFFSPFTRFGISLSYRVARTFAREKSVEISVIFDKRTARLAPKTILRAVTLGIPVGPCAPSTTSSIFRLRKRRPTNAYVLDESYSSCPTRFLVSLPSTSLSSIHSVAVSSPGVHLPVFVRFSMLFAFRPGGSRARRTR